MKPLNLATAIKGLSTLAIAAFSTSAVAAPEIYGQIRLSAVYNNESKVEYDDKTTKAFVASKSDRPNLASGNSRIGFKGSEKLSDELELQYKLEYKVDVAENTSTNFAARYGYLALDHKRYGNLLVGRTISVDDNIVTGYAWWRGVGIGPIFGHDANWLNNSFTYTSPKFNNGTTTAFVQYGMDEGEKGTRSFDTFENNVAKEASRDVVIVGASYEKDKVMLNATYTRAGDDLSSLRGSGEYKINDKLAVHSTVQYTDFNSSDNEIGVFGGAFYEFNKPWGGWIEAYYTDNYKGYDNGKAHGVNVGVQYEASKALTAYANVGYAKEEYGYGYQGSSDKYTDNTSYFKSSGKGAEIGVVYRF